MFKKFYCLSLLLIFGIAQADFCLPAFSTLFKLGTH